jgi:ubiquitin C-terminal hydrolase
VINSKSVLDKKESTNMDIEPKSGPEKKATYLETNGDTYAGASGLQNPTTYCYINSVVQCLMHTPAFADLFESQRYKNDLIKDHRGVAHAFAQLTQSNIRHEKNLSVRQLKTQVSARFKRFSSEKMQDA